MFRFEHIEYLYGLFLIPLFIVFFVVYQVRKRRNLAKIGDMQLVNTLLPEVSKGMSVLKLILILLAYASLVVAIANPQIGSKVEEAKRQGIDMMVCLDISYSMLAEDIQPNRLARSKQALTKLIDQLSGDRIGIVIFAGKAFVQLPLTNDYGAAKMFLENISPDLIQAQGTAIGTALDLAVNSFDQSKTGEQRSKAIILISDGENHEDDLKAAMDDAKDQNIIIHTIGMGLSAGAPIPIYQNGNQTGYRKDRDGNTIVTKLNEAMLQQIAQDGKGIYIQANNTTTGLQEIFKSIDKMAKNTYDNRMISGYESQHRYFIALALLLLFIEILLTEKRYQFLSKVRLFGEKKK